MRNTTIVVFALITIGILLSSTAYADVIPPIKQKKLGISNEYIVCDSGKFKVLKVNNDDVACVNPSHVYKLIANGWAKPVDNNKLNPYLDLEKKSTGSVNTLSIVPIKPTTGVMKEISTVVSYDYIFEVCVNQKIYNPTILITSDSESKYFELAENITPDKCVLSVSRIKAASMDSIKSTLLNKGEISQVITELENKISSLKEQLAETKKSLGKGQGQTNIQQGNAIADLRKQINDATAELHRLYFTMYTSSSKTTPLQKFSFSGKPIEGGTATKLAVAESLGGESQYVVTFEACAGAKQINLPIIKVSSDKQTMDVKIGAKIAPNSCQLTTAKIMADNPETITVLAVGNDSVNKVGDLENKIADLTQQLITEKEKLRTLIHNPVKPDDFTQQVDALSGKIIDLKNQIISTKGEFSQVMLETFR